jgi:hypothetical protein
VIARGEKKSCSEVCKAAKGWGCTGWRQTGGCDPDGTREAGGDKGCEETVVHGASGYCECEGGRRAQEVGCEHDSFQCAMECDKPLDTADMDAVITLAIAAVLSSIAVMAPLVEGANPAIHLP